LTNSDITLIICPYYLYHCIQHRNASLSCCVLV